MLYNVNEKVAAEMETLKKYIANYDIRVKAWEAVKPVTKKDGKEFAVFSKNFTGCKVAPHASYNDKADISIIVYFQDADGAYTYDWIRVNESVYDTEKLKNIPDNRIKYGDYGEAHIIDTVDHAWSKIREHIAQYENYKEETQKALDNAEKYLNEVVALATKFDALKKEAGSELSYRMDSLLKSLI